jgi:hypothetical protein
VKKLVLALLLISVGIAGAVSLLASGQPDGLEHSLEKLGVEETPGVLDSPMADYQAPVALSAGWRRALAGVSGTLVVFGLVLLAGRFLRRRDP